MKPENEVFNEIFDRLLGPERRADREEPFPADPAIAAGAVPGDLPSHIRRRLDEQPVEGQRSTQSYTLVGLLCEWGYDDETIVATAREHRPTRAKYGRRVDDEIARVIAKHRANHQHIGKPCDKAGCPNTPWWMSRHTPEPRQHQNPRTPAEGRGSVDSVDNADDTSAMGPDASREGCVDSVVSVDTDGTPVWAEPVPLVGAADLPAFPVDALPAWCGDWVRAEADAAQVPPDLPGMLMLTCLATAAGGLVRIEVRSGWHEPLNLYSAVGMDSGSRKSKVFCDATRPLIDFERSEAERMAGIIREAMTAKKIAERRAEHAQAVACKASDAEAVTSTADAISAANAAAAVLVPAAPRLFADDATPEALTSLLADSEHSRIAVLSDEGGVFEMMAGRYSASGTGPNLDVYLKGHVGTDLRVDRKGRPAEYVRRPALTIGLAVQPDVLRSLARRPGFRGRGLIGRFLYALPQSLVGRRVVGAPPVPDDIRDRYEHDMRALVRTLREEAELDRVTGTSALVLKFTGEAAEAMLEFERAIEPRLDRVAGDLGSIQDWGGKLVGSAVRIAGLLHLANHLHDGWTPDVDVDTVHAALKVAYYLIPHALAVYDLMGADPATADAQYILDWITRTGTKELTRRDLMVRLPRGRFGKVGMLQGPLDVLAAHGYVRQRPRPPSVGKPGRPPSPAYEVNPAVHPPE